MEAERARLPWLSRRFCVVVLFSAPATLEIDDAVGAVKLDGSFAGRVGDFGFGLWKPVPDVAEVPDGTFFAVCEAVGAVADERAVEDVAGFGAPFAVELFAVALEDAEALLTFLLLAVAFLSPAAAETGVLSSGGDLNGFFALEDVAAGELVAEDGAPRIARAAFAGVAFNPWTAASLIDLASPPVRPLIEPPWSAFPSVTALSSFGSAGFICTPG